MEFCNTAIKTQGNKYHILLRTQNKISSLSCKYTHLHINVERQVSLLNINIHNSTRRILTVLYSRMYIHISLVIGNSGAYLPKLIFYFAFYKDYY